MNSSIIQFTAHWPMSYNVTLLHTSIYLISMHYISLHIYTVLPPNSRFLGLRFFREFEIRELKIHDFPPNSL